MTAENKTKGQLERELMEVRHALQMKNEQATKLEKELEAQKAAAEASRSVPGLVVCLDLWATVLAKGHGVKIESLRQYLEFHAKQDGEVPDGVIHDLKILIGMAYKTAVTEMSPPRGSWPFHPFDGWIGPRRG